MCVTRKENLEKTADKIIAINDALNSEVVHAFKTLSRSLQGVVFSLESLRENGCEYFKQLEDYLLNEAELDAAALLALSKEVASLARKLSGAAANAKKYKEREEEQERKEQEERARKEREDKEEQEQKDLDKAQYLLEFNLEQCAFFIQNAKDEDQFILDVMAGRKKNEADTLEVRRARIEHWFFNADWWLKEAEKELEARPTLKSVKNGFYRDVINEKREYLNTVRKTSND